MATHAITDMAIVLKPHDDVAIAKREIAAGTVLEDADGRIEARQDIRPGHKIARRAVRPGDAVRRYGQIIGFATAEIAAGDHVHTQNLAVGDLRQDYEFCTDVQPVDYYPASRMRYFDGYKREDGRVGTRNYVAIISGVNCSASVSQFVKDRFRDVQKRVPERRRRARDHAQVGLRHQALRRGPHGAAARPRRLRQAPERGGLHPDRTRLRGESGGRHGRQAAHGGAGPSRTAAVRHQYPGGGGHPEDGGARDGRGRQAPADRQRGACGRRSRCPELVLATNCGGSDGNSGITANPALGWAVDELVRYGGTGVLAETPEIYGAEHLLIRRAINEGVGKKLIDRYKWWEWYCRGIEAMDNNPAPGNKAGGLTDRLREVARAASARAAPRR